MYNYCIKYYDILNVFLKLESLYVQVIDIKE